MLFSLTKNVSIAVICVCITAAFASGVENQPANESAQMVPASVLNKMILQFIPPSQRLSPPETAKLLKSRMDMVMQLGQEAEQNYPDASNIYSVRMYMLRAMHFLAMSNKDDASFQRLDELIKKILTSDAPIENKAMADFVKTAVSFEELFTSSDKGDFDKPFRDYVTRYEQTDAAAFATLKATIAANMNGRDKLANELLEKLEQKYLDDYRVKDFLRQIGRYTDIGKPFKAELTRLDGEKLTLPDDLAGKILIVDFWATWCPECVAEMPELKEFYANNKDKGLEVVTISLDDDLAEMEKFVKSQDLSWINTFAGQGMIDPTAIEYGVKNPPRIFIIGRDGKMISNKAFGNWEKIVTQELNEQ